MPDPLGVWPKDVKDSWTKEHIEGWSSAASEGEKKAIGEVAIAFHKWEAQFSNGFFGMDVDPNKRKSVLMALCQQYQCHYGPATYLWPIRT